MIYQTNDIYEKWNGRYNNQGDVIVQEGSYAFYIQYTDVDGSYREKKGMIHLIK